LELLLSHARDLTERLVTRSRRAVWPRPYNVLAGDLWLEVDRFDDARAAFERAVKADASPLAIVGLSRALVRLGRRDEACRTLARLPVDAVSLRDATREEFAECR
jgi:predicted Zn-dependent protease